jgi:hypothetical protein
MRCGSFPAGVAASVVRMRVACLMLVVMLIVASASGACWLCPVYGIQARIAVSRYAVCNAKSRLMHGMLTLRGSHIRNGPDKWAVVDLVVYSASCRRSTSGTT